MLRMGCFSDKNADIVREISWEGEGIFEADSLCSFGEIADLKLIPDYQP